MKRKELSDDCRLARREFIWTLPASAQAAVWDSIERGESHTADAFQAGYEAGEQAIISRYTAKLPKWVLWLYRRFA